MIVAFLDDQAVGTTLEPPKIAHITVKKKFKLAAIDELGLIRLLQQNAVLSDTKKVITGGSKEYGSAENMIISVINDDVWRSVHQHLLKLLVNVTESRDPHFEGENYLPHITWRLRGENNLDPKEFENRQFVIEHLYLIERAHPTKSVARVVAKISTSSQLKKKQ